MPVAAIAVCRSFALGVFHHHTLLFLLLVLLLLLLLQVQLQLRRLLQLLLPPPPAPPPPPSVMLIFIHLNLPEDHYPYHATTPNTTCTTTTTNVLRYDGYNFHTSPGRLARPPTTCPSSRGRQRLVIKGYLFHLSNMSFHIVSRSSYSHVMIV